MKWLAAALVAVGYLASLVVLSLFGHETIALLLIGGPLVALLLLVFGGFL